MKVHVNFEKLSDNANDYLSYSEELEAILNDCKKISEDINNKWESKNTPISIDILNQIINLAQKDANKMKTYGRVLLGIDEDFKNKDLEYQKQFNNDYIEGEDQ